jgi:hypothetical protein
MASTRPTLGSIGAPHPSRQLASPTARRTSRIPDRYAATGKASPVLASGQRSAVQEPQLEVVEAQLAQATEHGRQVVAGPGMGEVHTEEPLAPVAASVGGQPLWVASGQVAVLGRDEGSQPDAGTPTGVPDVVDQVSQGEEPAGEARPVADGRLPPVVHLYDVHRQLVLVEGAQVLAVVSSVTSVKYWYQVHQTVGAARSRPATARSRSPRSVSRHRGRRSPP